MMNPSRKVLLKVAIDQSSIVIKLLVGCSQTTHQIIDLQSSHVCYQKVILLPQEHKRPTALRNFLLNPNYLTNLQESTGFQSTTYDN